ncbi:alpha/beta hydrolase [Vibrio superstes]|nr:alpha/beta fold hydrolase [Vibrio superstes]
MSRKGVLLLVLSLISTIAISVIVASIIAQQQFQESTFTSSSQGVEKPTDIGLKYEKIDIILDGRILKAWYVPAKNEVGAVLVFHGQNESLSSWISAIQRLNNYGLSVFLFDYSGFGDSQGEPSVTALREDAGAAYKEFRRWRTDTVPSYFLGYSLGTGILIDALSHYDMPADGIILASPFSTIRDVAIEEGSILPLFSFLVPNAYDNVEGVMSIKLPIHIIHSETDGRFPVWMAQQIASATPNADLVVVPTPTHSEFLASPLELGGDGKLFWGAVLHAMHPN